MVRRWWIYIREVFQPGSRLLYTVVLYAGVALVLQALSSSTTEVPLRLSASAIPGCAVVLLVLLYYRCADELKDADTDRRFFPERPVPSGRVTLRDLGWLMAAVWAALGLVIAVSRLAVPWALGLWAFAFLMHKWFFLPGLIGNNRLLAFVTHSPISLIANLFIVAADSETRGAPVVPADAASVAVWFALPGFSWEVSRKTWAPEQEREGYQTYSAMVGYRASAAVSIVFVVLQAILTGFLRERLGLSVAYVATFGVALLGFALVHLVFMARPGPTSRWLRPSAEAFALVALLGVVVDLAARRGVAWSWAWGAP